MRNLINALSAEALKLKRTFILWIVVLVPVIFILTQSLLFSTKVSSYISRDAWDIISEYGISDKVQIQQADANGFPVDKFDVIIISQGIKPYKELLKHISQSMKDDARVIFRTSSSPDGEISQSDLFIKDLFKFFKL